MDFFTDRKSSSNVKLSGMENGLDLEADKVNLNTFVPSIQQRMQEELIKKQMLNRQFDPNYMEVNIAEPCDTGNISFDPTEMKFDI